MATAGSWSTNWSTGYITTDAGNGTDDGNGTWYSTESVPSSAFSYRPAEQIDYWINMMDKDGKIEMCEAKYEEKDHLAELKELFEI